MIEPFRINIAPAVVADLRRRIGATRWPAGVGDSGGLPVADVQKLLGAWREDYDWFACERRLNAFPQFRAATADGAIHFLHLRAHAENACPLLLLHGWPGSFVELLDLATRLQVRFHIVLPSIPGFGFSDIPARAGISGARIAEMLAGLMAELGYRRFAVHGGDIGAGIATRIARSFPQRVRALHLNYISAFYTPLKTAPLTAEEREYLVRSAEWETQSGAYEHLQRTTPLTAAYGLSDSPAGLAAWIAEKFRLWADPASQISRQALLTNLSIYWFTNTIHSSMRYYLESAQATSQPQEAIRVPTFIAQFPFEMPCPPRSWVERAYAVRRWTSMPRGGHFAALEVPELLAADILSMPGLDTG